MSLSVVHFKMFVIPVKERGCEKMYKIHAIILHKNIHINFVFRYFLVNGPVIQELKCQVIHLKLSFFKKQKTKKVK